MEQFIEDTRRILAARAYELTKPRTMDQTLIAAFPSVFLVYFQWHHNFRNVYPKVPKKKVDENLLVTQKQQAEEKLKNRIYADDVQKVKYQEVARQQKEKDTLETERMQQNRRQEDDRLRFNLNEDKKRADVADDRLRMSFNNKEKEQVQTNLRTQKEKEAETQSNNKTAAALAAELSQRQNSI